MSVRILIGDVFERLAELADDSVHCVVTSPPYWGLRDYGVTGQLGLESTLGEHLEIMVRVFREVRRVLRPDGTLWLNYGDCYQSGSRGLSGKTRGADSPMQQSNLGSDTIRAPNRLPQEGLKDKDLCMVPARVALALQADGWWLRSMLPWVKRNSMPESVTDRPATAVEYMFLLTKRARYFYDAEAVRTLSTASEESQKRAKYGRYDAGGGKGASPSAKPDFLNVQGNYLAGEKKRYKMPDGRDTGLGGHGTIHREGREKGKPPDKQRGHSRRHAGFNDLWDAMGKAEQQAGGRNFRNTDLFYESIEGPHGLISGADGEPLALDVCPQPFPGAHFATFPPRLIEPLIKAGTSERGVCPECGAPWVRETKRQDQGWDGSRYGEQAVTATGGAKSGGTKKSTLGSSHGELTGKTETTGWAPSCKCDADPTVPATVLDPFAGSGTVGLIADRLGRDAILIELSPEYAEMARRRIEDDAGLFAEMET